MINLSVIGVLYVLEYLWLMKHETRKIINYDRIDLIKTENHEALKQDLEARTGLIINRFEIGKIDFLNDTCLIRVYYFAEDQDFSNYGG
jgi:hypothetical protein